MPESILKIFVAALLLVAGAATAHAADPPDPPGCPVAALKKELKGAPQTVLSLRAQTKKLRAQLPTLSDDECRGALFRVYWEFYGFVQGALTPNGGDDSSEGGGGGSAERDRLERSLRLVGWRLAASEAGDYVTEDRDWLPRYLGPALPAMWREYITLRIGDSVHGGLTEDAGLKIGWDALRARIERWEAFVARYPSFIWKRQTVEDNKVSLQILLRGVDNSLVFSRDDETLLPEVRKELEAYAANKAAARGAVVRRYLAMLKKNGWKESEEAGAYLDKQGLKTMNGVEPPRE